MCVICYIPKGVKTPSYRMLKAMHNANPHGQGFCTPSQFSKGLNFEYFVEQLRKRDINEPCIMHFRLATHGRIKKANCHPFNIDHTYFAHNGILSVRPMRDKTDSETAFIRYLYPYIEQYGLHSPEVEKMVYNLIESSKFAFMQGDDVRLFGHYEEMDGCYYSNLRFTYYIPRLHPFSF